MCDKTKGRVLGAAFVLMGAPHTDESHRLVGAAKLVLTKKGAVACNRARHGDRDTFTPGSTAADERRT